MIEYYLTGPDGVTKQVNEPQPGCWINVVAPTDRERAWLLNSAGILPEFIRSALDEEESAHVDYDDDARQTLVIVDCPAIADEEHAEDASMTEYETHPLSVLFLTDQDMLVTISLHENTAIDDLAAGKIRALNTNQRTRILLQLLLKASQKYVVYLRNIARQFSRTEARLHASMKNPELIKMLGLQKSLVYFSISLKADRVMLDRISGGRVIRLYEDDRDLLEDVLIEFRQAIEMCDIYSNILSGTMDTFGNVISNNLNSAMKTLTAITLVLAIPNVVFSFYGMNVDTLPLTLTWLFPLGMAVVGCVIAALVFRKKDMFR